MPAMTDGLVTPAVRTAAGGCSLVLGCHKRGTLAKQIQAERTPFRRNEPIWDTSSDFNEIHGSDDVAHREQSEMRGQRSWISLRFIRATRSASGAQNRAKPNEANSQEQSQAAQLA